jgi:hypothetical protein
MSRPSRAAALKAMAAIDNQIEDGQAEDNTNNDNEEVVLSEESDQSGYCSQDSVSSNDSSPFVKARAPKSQFQIDAEEAVCRGLDLTKKEFATLRASLKYVYRCLNLSWSMDDFLDKVFETLHFEQQISEENKVLACNLTRMLIRNINIPYEYIATTFVPLHEFNGGIYTTLSKAMRKVFGIAILVDLVEQIIDATANGTTQQQGMEFILRGIGLGDDAALMLAATSSDQTLQQSIESGGSALVAKINALPEEHRLKCCLMEVSTLRINGGTRVMPRTSTSQAWCSVLFDNSPTHSAADTMVGDCNLQVAVNLVTHEGSTVDKALTGIHGADYCVRTAGYRPFYIGYGDLDSSIPLRASTIIEAACPENIYKSFKAIVGNDDQHKDIGPNLKAVLDGAFSTRHGNRFHLPAGTLIGASYNNGGGKRWLKIGKEKPSDRLASVHISDDKCRPTTTSWMVIEEDLKTKEFLNLMTPPWFAYNNGTLDFFIIPPMKEAEMTSYPEINEKLTVIRTEALSLGHVRDSQADMASEKAKKAKKAEILTKPDGRKSARKLKEAELELIELAGEEAHNAALEKSVRVTYRSTVYPDWHPKSALARRFASMPALAPQYEAAKRKRDETLEKGNASKRARDTVEEHRRLRPGGEEYKKAEASFEAAVATM